MSNGKTGENSARGARGSEECAALDGPMLSMHVGAAEIVRTRDRVAIHAGGRLIDLRLDEARSIAAALLHLTR